MKKKNLNQATSPCTSITSFFRTVTSFFKSEARMRVLPMRQNILQAKANCPGKKNKHFSSPGWEKEMIFTRALNS